MKRQCVFCLTWIVASFGALATRLEDLEFLDGNYASPEARAQVGELREHLQLESDALQQKINIISALQAARQRRSSDVPLEVHPHDHRMVDTALRLQADRARLTGGSEWTLDAEGQPQASEVLSPASILQHDAQLNDGSSRFLSDDNFYANQQQHSRADLQSESKSIDPFKEMYPYILLFGELGFFLMLGLCAGVGCIADISDEDSIEIPWYCSCCVGLSQCFMGICVHPPFLIGFVVFLIVMNGGLLFLEKSVESYGQKLLLMAFAGFLVIFLIFMILSALQHYLRQLPVYKRVHGALQSVEALATFFEKTYGKKWYRTIRDSGQFAQKDLRQMKSRMMASNAWTADKIDDVGDFFGLGEPSSEDDITYKMVPGIIEARWKGGTISEAVRKEQHELHRITVEGKKKAGGPPASTNTNDEGSDAATDRGGCF